VLVALVSFAAIALADVRWLRVAQREHYIPGSCVKVAMRWAATRPPNQLVAAVAGAAVLLALAGRPPAVALCSGLVAAAAAAVFPVAMPVLGREQHLVRTARLTRLAASCVLLEAVTAAVALWLGAPAATGALAVGVPVVVDGAALLMRPVEARLARHWRTAAQATLNRVGPRVIAVTGSYGKTSTKNHIRDLVSGTFDVVASPASWNNEGGLARTVNEYLGPHTQVMVAEMGTYGPGEIRAMCSWVRPDIGVITAIGPMHLERMKTLDTVVRAKSELLEGVRVAILNVDDERLERLAGSVTAQVWRCGTRRQAGLDVSLERENLDRENLDRENLERENTAVTIRFRGEAIGSASLQPGLHLGNVACALAAALAAGVPAAQAVARLGDLTAPPHRAVHAVASSGIVVVDDTYNSNPEGAMHALDLLGAAVPSLNRRAVVTPGMVELGSAQDEANRAFAEAVAKAGAVLVVVGWTNRRALLAGAQGGEVVTARSRAAAQEWVRSSLAAGDGVLWENDLPNHYP
jgi:UDP-N-acetylmuramoyl-tripeptide--D-alanyl-D-alanine ligase